MRTTEIITTTDLATAHRFTEAVLSYMSPLFDEELEEALIAKLYVRLKGSPQEELLEDLLLRFEEEAFLMGEGPNPPAVGSVNLFLEVPAWLEQLFAGLDPDLDGILMIPGALLGSLEASIIDLFPIYRSRLAPA